MIRNTPLLIQIFIVYFGLSSLGLKLSAEVSAVVALTVNMGAYTTEIMRAGIQSIQRTQLEAADCLGLTRLQTILHVVLLPAMERVYPALSSQFVLLMLASSITSQISAEELTATANLVQSDTYRSFEVYVIVAVVYLALSALYRFALVADRPRAVRAPPPAGDAAVIQLSAPMSVYLVEAARWTVLLSLIAFAGGALVGLPLALMRVSPLTLLRGLASAYIQIVQGTPLLIVLFLSYSGLGIMGYKLDPLVAAGLSSRSMRRPFWARSGAVASRRCPRRSGRRPDCLGLNAFQQYAYVILPQACASPRRRPWASWSRS